jgi:O-antigen/teichoic acid export membrane protein
MVRLRILMQSPLMRNVSTLVGGTAFSQLIGLLALPILTRLYTPEDFTVLATYISIFSLLSVIACLRFEIAIPIPKDQKNAIQLLCLSVISVICITLLTWLTVTLGANWINQVTSQRLVGYLWLLPLGVFFSGLYNALQYWMTREKAFPLVAKTRITQSISGAITQIGLGYMGLTPIGLLLGQLFNSGAGIVGLSRSFFRNYKSQLFRVNFIGLKETFRQYERFPKYSTLEALTNSAGIQVPILIIATLAIGKEAGFLMLAMRLLSAPMGLIGGSVAQVYLTEAADRYHKGELKDFTNKTIVMLAKIASIPLVLVAITAPVVVPFIFGDSWYRTGELISWMAPWFFVQFIVSPVSMALHITDNQRIAMILQFAGLILRGGSVWVSVLYFNNLVGEVYAVSGALFYLLYLFLIRYVLNKKVL